MANFPTSPSTGSIFSTGRNVYKYNGTAWETISPNISVGFPEMTGSFNDLSGSLPNISNVGAFVPSNITASVLQLDGAFSYDSSHTSIPTTGSGVKLRATTGHTEGLIFHMKADGPNGGTSFIDSSTSGHTIVTTGNAKISTTYSVFGTSSAYFDGTRDLLSVTSSAFNFTTEDFTIECWIKTTDNDYDSNAPHIVSMWDHGNAKRSWTIQMYSGNLTAYLSTGGGSPYTALESSLEVTNNQWHHVALCRSGATVRLFLNGVVGVASSVGSSYGLYSDGNKISIGSDTSNGDLDYIGWIDDLRIYRGVAKYTSAFTVQDATNRQDILLPPDAPTLTIENKYNNILKEYTVNMTSDDTRMALTGSN